ncbi:Dfp1/Him1, central region-domain-containing protein [Pseudomassariella vexata]|uniref:Dfp1/Him1, central region-domain-containing protein n=1 Tax=Pseudomassariella vexata TaxID=1141098 RepID=A0A1Y2DQP2_9PEZI|nr:Dfp1/Him1, central region-domain-containing protein [Pseudomassariella vexata]ORY61601.1 Dfp1/Him1, central region-domain-containing protein [Pseudomassariella vexata]
MAAVSLSPTPILLSTMSGTTRRIPLSSNQNVANSPLRGSAAANAAAKQKRSYANLQREEPYGQPPPAKKQILESGIPRAVSTKSPVQHQVTKSQVTLQTRRNASSYEVKLARERSGYQQQHQQAVSNTGTKYTEKDLEQIREWKNHHKARFPKMVFYFETIPTETRAKLAKQIASLGAREEKFFSNQITHIVTTRSIPPERAARPRHEDTNGENDGQEQEQVKTINPSLLNRLSDKPVKRQLFPPSSTTKVPSRSPLTQITQIPTAQPKRNMDVLHRARDMGKKIWSLDKLQRMLSMLLEQDLHISAAIAYGSKRGADHANLANTKAEESNLLQLLQHERVNGPSDRDHTVATQEMVYFKGPYIYVYDFEEKQKPIMVREYNKVVDKADGEWPQFRSAALGRCPFVEDYDREVIKAKPKPKLQAVKPAVEAKPVVQQPAEAPMSRPATTKRSLSEMESAHNRGSSVASTEFIAPKPVVGKTFEFGRPNAFTSRAASGKLFGGEPVASGVQPSNVTSAIRSQMISSTAATPGAIGILSKEVHGLQRKVLQRNSSHDLSSRRAGSAETSFRDDGSVKRSLTLGRTSSRKLGLIDETGATNEEAGDAPVQVQEEKRSVEKKKKRDLKPGYCENCQDKFADFEEHIESKKHRRFADNLANWADLDDLLSQLERVPKSNYYSTWAPSLPELGAY